MATQTRSDICRHLVGRRKGGGGLTGPPDGWDRHKCRIRRPNVISPKKKKKDRGGEIVVAEKLIPTANDAGPQAGNSDPPALPLSSE